MDNFDKIIKSKVEQFEVPYNDAHWAEMEGKLEAVRIAKIKKTILSIAAGVVGISLAAYLIFPGPKSDSDVAEKVTENTAVESILPENNNTSQEAVKVVSPVNVESNHEDQSTTDVAEENNPMNESSESAENNSVVNEESSNTASEIVEESKPEPKENSTQTSTSYNADFIVYNNKVCLGEKVSFEPLTTDGPISYVWNFGDGKISYKTNPSHSYEHSGNYDITLTIIDRETGKEYTEIKRNQVTILASAQPSFTYYEESKKQDDNKLMYPYTIFKVKGTCDGCSFKWNFGNGVTAKNATPKTIYKKEGSYNVTLIAENANGCVSTIERRVTIKNGVDLYAPNAFTPDGDGLNDNFMPIALTEWDIPFEMVITTKAGKTIYKTSDESEGWNGKLNNTGQLLDQGIYFWQVVITDAYGIKHSYQGDIKLMK